MMRRRRRRRLVSRYQRCRPLAQESVASLLAAEGTVQSQARPRGICGGHSATVTHFPPIASYLFCQYYFRNVPRLYFVLLPPTLDKSTISERRYVTHLKKDDSISQKLAAWVSSLCRVTVVVQAMCLYCGRVCGYSLNPHSWHFRRVPTATESAYRFLHVDPYVRLSVCLCMYVCMYVVVCMYVCI